MTLSDIFVTLLDIFVTLLDIFVTLFDPTLPWRFFDEALKIILYVKNYNVFQLLTVSDSAACMASFALA